MAELYRYAAFISYSSKDAKFAQRLHRALESYGIPSSLGKFDLIGGGGKQNRIYPVFRDREELSAGHLGDQIEANLKASAALIVVCSPNGAASPWVQKEIEFFAALGRHAKIFAIISDTAPLTDETGADCTQSCFPPAFRGDALSGDKLEPLAADARKGRDGFRNAWLKIVAGMIGVAPGQILDRDKRRRRQQAVRALAVWVLALMGVGSVYSQRETLEPMVISYLQYKRFVNPDIASAAPGTTFQDCERESGDCPVMMMLPAGEFVMGSPPEYSAEEESPQRQVFIARLAVSQNEVTFADWNACVTAGGCDGYQPDRSGWEGDNRPVINVSWDDAQKYVAWLSRMTGQHYRLLSEAEWEYAARGVTTPDSPHTRFSWGNDDPVCERAEPNGAAFNACPEQSTLTVGSFAANAFGLHDMHGNVWEWVEDCYAPYDPEQRDGAAVRSEAEADAGPATETVCSGRVLRGGSWYHGPEHLRSALRFAYSHTDRFNHLGFRVARTVSPPNR